MILITRLQNFITLKLYYVKGTLNGYNIGKKIATLTVNKQKFCQVFYNTFGAVFVCESHVCTKR